jgi:hypothetical protein
MQAPPTNYHVTICGDTYDIYANRFEQTEENLQGIGAFHSNFRDAVAALTKSNVLRAPPENYIYGNNPQERLLEHRIYGNPYPYYLGHDAFGNPFQNPPPATNEDNKQWTHLLRSIETQKHEDMKVLRMLWSWIGDFRRHTLSHIYRDTNKTTRQKIMEIIQTHKDFLQDSIPIIISRYRSVWHQQKIHICTDLLMAVKNLHILQNINNNIMDMDPQMMFTGNEMAIELIPTLQHDNFAPVILDWNAYIKLRRPIAISTIQPDLEKCFVVKTSINDPLRYAHVSKTPQPQSKPSSTASSSASQSPTKSPYAYAATSQDHSLPTS